MTVNTSYQDHYHQYRHSDGSEAGLRGKMTFVEFADFSKQEYGVQERDARKVFDLTIEADPNYLTIAEFGNTYQTIQNQSMETTEASAVEPVSMEPVSMEPELLSMEPEPDNRLDNKAAISVIEGLADGSISPSQVQTMLSEGLFDRFSEKFNAKLARDTVTLAAIFEGGNDGSAGIDAAPSQSIQDGLDFINNLNSANGSSISFDDNPSSGAYDDFSSGSNNDDFNIYDDYNNYVDYEGSPGDNSVSPNSSRPNIPAGPLSNDQARQVMIGLRDQSISPDQVRDMLVDGQFDNFSRGFREKLARTLNDLETVRQA